MKQPLFGAAYYDEYMPYERSGAGRKDDEKSRDQRGAHCGIHLEHLRTLGGCIRLFPCRAGTGGHGSGRHSGDHRHTHLCHSFLDGKILSGHFGRDKKGRGIYGPRQIMDITHPVYLFYAERVIRRLMEVTAKRKCVIGFQIDNETKYYGTGIPFTMPARLTGKAF